MAKILWEDAEIKIVRDFAKMGLDAIFRKLRAEGFQRTPNAVKGWAQRNNVSFGPLTDTAYVPYDYQPPEDSKKKLLAELVKSHSVTSLEAACDTLNVPPKRVRELVSELLEEGYQIALDEMGGVSLNRHPTGVVAKHTHTFEGAHYRFGLISDTHLGSTYADLTLLKHAYEVFKEEGIIKVYHAGNIAEGQDSYRGQNNVLVPGVWGVENQAAYVAEHYPKDTNITTYFIGSSTCHEGAYYKREGLQFGIMVQRLRSDLKYLGLDEADIVLKGSRGSATMRLMHPGGGSAYALSYRPQKIVESFSGGEKPNILVIGHYHKMLYADIRNVHVICAGCVEFQTDFMRKLAIEAHRGFWIVEATVEEDGSVTKLQMTPYRYFLGAPQLLGVSHGAGSGEKDE